MNFANGAQKLLFDQFIAADYETKWAQTQRSCFVMPWHGRPRAEHSGTRLEKILVQLCANANIQVCYFTNAAQIYHALKRQLHRNFRKPLIIMTPKKAFA